MEGAGRQLLLSYVGADTEYISDPGLTMYWVVFGLMAGSAIGFGVFVFRRDTNDRSHGYCTMLIVTIASIAYYSMAAWGGSAPITTYTVPGVRRPIYWARYVDWTFTTPLLLLDLLLIAGVPFGTTLWILVSDVIMIVLGLFGATSSHRQKWGFYGMSCLFLLFVNIGLLGVGVKYAKRRSARIGTIYTGLALYLTVAWWGYPLVWGFAEGSNTITPNAEAFCYGGLDIATKVFFGWTVILLGPILLRQNEIEYQKGKFLPQLLDAPINALLSPALHDTYTQEHGGTTGYGGGVHNNPVAQHGIHGVNGRSDGDVPVSAGGFTDTKGPHESGNLNPLHSDSHLGPNAIHSSNTPGGATAAV